MYRSFKLAYFALLLLVASCGSNGDWRTASRESAGIAPEAAKVEDDIFQIYVARAWSWRGYFGVHPWVAWKRSGESEYTTAAIIGWRLGRHESAVEVKQDVPDRRWFGQMPQMIFQAHGKRAKAIINQAQELIKNYPYKGQYRVWPGPNSNTFVSYLIRNIDEIDAELPPHAVGKDWLVKSYVFDKSPSGTGAQMNILGVAGITVGLEEGIEFNLLGLSFGIDVYPPAIKLPMLGRIGFDDGKVEPLPMPSIRNN